MRLACVTMAFNEPDMLPLWVAHYAPYDRFVIDHGTDDGSTARLSVERVRIPRSAHDNRRRADFVQDFTRALLRYYDAVLFTDVDELVRPDPAEHATLSDYAAAHPLPVTTAIGVNLLHRLHHEGRFETSRSLWLQRGFAFPTASMCKPVLIREPVVWSRGFHTWNGPVSFGRLFLFHLAYFDRTIALRRQAKRRSVQGASMHHQAEDDLVAGWMEGWSAMPVVEPTWAPDCPFLGAFAAKVVASQFGRDAEEFTIDLEIGGDRLWTIPARFRQEPGDNWASDTGTAADVAWFAPNHVVAPGWNV